MYSYIIQGSNIVVVIDNKIHTVNKSHPTYTSVYDALKAQDWVLLKEIIEPKSAVMHYSKGNVTIDDKDIIYWKGVQFNNTLAVKMIQMLQEGFSIDPMVAFMENLMSNPSTRAIDELYGFLEKGNLPITPDGYFLAYKKVRQNYLDCHSGTMDNSVGKTVSMSREDVNDNKDQTCSAGLHFCSIDYLSNFGGDRIMILKINPRDVVSIPSDYNDTKGRACSYDIIGELNVDAKDAFVKSVQETAIGSEPPLKKVVEVVKSATPKKKSKSTKKPAVSTTGKPLSMTKNAIRKRARRAALLLNGVV